MIKATLAILASVIVAGCVSYDVLSLNAPYEKPASVSDADMTLFINDWLNCDECQNGQLRRVQELGNSAVPDLTDAFNGVALPDRRAFFEGRCDRLNTVLLARGFDTHDCDLYKERFQQNLERRYERRAFSALVAIRTQDSCAVVGGEARCKDFPRYEPYEVVIRTGRSTRLGIVE